MKRLLTLVSILVMPINAIAADLFGGSIKDDAAQYAPAFSWMRCYVGANVGTASQSSGTVFAGTPDVAAMFNNGSNTTYGIIGGGQLGCDYQRGRFVFGIQGMFVATSLDGSNNYTEGTGLSSTRTEAKWFSTLTGRIGIGVTPTTLIYAKGGVAWVKNDYTDSCLTTCNGADGANQNYVGIGRDTRKGWLVGGGLEHALDDRWSIFAEYSYTGFSSKKTTITEKTFGYNWQNDYDHGIQAIKFGINLRFNWVNFRGYVQSGTSSYLINERGLEVSLEGLTILDMDWISRDLSASLEDVLEPWVIATLLRSSNPIGAFIEKELRLVYESRPRLIVLLDRISFNYHKLEVIPRKL